MLELSIVIPVYNIRDYLFRCIKSISDQMDDRVEVIIVDDGSPDDSIATIEDLCKGYEQIYIYHKENGGLSSARNYGLEKARGRYVYFVDGDDFLVEGVLSDLVDRLEENQGPCMVVKHMTLEEVQRVPLKDNAAVAAALIPMNTYLKNYRNPITNVWKIIVLRQLLLDEELVFRPGVLCEDVEWITKLMMSVEEVVFIDRYVYVYDNTRSDSIMNVLSVKRIVDLDENIYQTKCVVDEIQDTEKRLALKKLLFIEWCMNLSFYSRLEKSDKKQVHLHDSFSKDREHKAFQVFGRAKGLLGLGFMAHSLHGARRLRKKIKRVNVLNGVKKRIME